MGGVPTPKDPVIPAKAPTRAAGVAPEDIVLGGMNNLDDTTTTQGKRSLTKPTGFLSGLNMGV